MLTSLRIMIGCWSHSTGARVFSNQLEQADRISWWHFIDFPSADKVTLQKSSASKNLLENLICNKYVRPVTPFCSPECRGQLLIIVCPSQHEVFVSLWHSWWSSPNFRTTFETLKAFFVWVILFSRLLNAGCITFQIMIGTQQLMMLTVRATPESWHRIGGSRSHYRPAWCRAWSGRRSAAARWRCSISSWRWSSPTCPCCSGSGISSRRRGRWGAWCHKATGGWTRWTRTTWPSCPVWVPGGWGTSGRWTRWTRLCGGLPSWLAKLSSIVTSLVMAIFRLIINDLFMYSSFVYLTIWFVFLTPSLINVVTIIILLFLLMICVNLPSLTTAVAATDRDILESCDSQSWVGAGARGESRAGALAKLPPSEGNSKV